MKMRILFSSAPILAIGLILIVSHQNGWVSISNWNCFASGIANNNHESIIISLFM